MLTPPQAIEAILFASGEVMGKSELATLLEIEVDDLHTALKALTRELASRGIALVETEREVELRTAPAAAEIVKRMRERELSRDLGKASLETLAVIAYRRGSTRSEIDWVRGVNSSASVRTLLLRGLIEGAEDEQDRRKIRYGITTEALAHLGVRSADKLPRFVELSSETASAAVEPVAE